jgi:hypothetical protein
MSALKDVVSLYQLLKLEWTKKPPKLEKCGELLTKLKVGWLNTYLISSMISYIFVLLLDEGNLPFHHHGDKI